MVLAKACGVRIGIQLAIILMVSWLLVACQSTPTPYSSTSPTELTTGSKPAVNKTIALLGGTGMVGQFILNEALQRGYKVRVLARTPAKLDEVKGRVTIVQGDARDRHTIDKLLHGSDVVLSALGPVRADGKAANSVSTIASGHILEAMKENNVRRYILVSGAAVTVPEDQRNFSGWLIQKLAQLTLSSVVQDKQQEYQLLADSEVSWTLVRCPLIEAEPFQSLPVASLDSPYAFKLRAGELARFMIEQIDSVQFSEKAPFLGSQ